jgi:hypothetical protein
MGLTVIVTSLFRTGGIMFFSRIRTETGGRHFLGTIKIVLLEKEPGVITDKN